jgi:hypothetical protein
VFSVRQGLNYKYHLRHISCSEVFKSTALSAFSYEFSFLYVLEQSAGCMPNKSGPNVSEIQDCTCMSFGVETNVH